MTDDLEKRIASHLDAKKSDKSQHDDAFEAWSKVAVATLTDYVCPTFIKVSDPLGIKLVVESVESWDATQGPAQDGIFPMFVAEAKLNHRPANGDITCKVEITFSHKKLLLFRPKVDIIYEICSETLGKVYSFGYYPNDRDFKVRSFAVSDVKPKLEPCIERHLRRAGEKMIKQELL
ncbi:hypothetical protein [Gimesia aquarii]|uniref:Uncharacterized protein n=1 Tax=Gimesia aquarii TaxID=2527964 RepID=A0A517X1A4_9PLAN|nr:hypothetical protein [Gimesia aquarii]QDU11279.1 hypothetical protein V202x_46980 [Gimesia aquarii]